MRISYDVELDVKGLKCPLPILRTKKMLFQMASGEILRVITTDQSSLYDFQVFSKQTGNILLEQKELENGEIIHYFLRR